MKTFIACIATETNSFSPLPTGLAAWEEGHIHHGTATQAPPVYWTGALKLWRDAAEAKGWPVVESLAAFAQPGGLTPRKVYEEFRDEIVADLKAAMPVDIVALQMHGAMIADGYPDCEGDLIAACRAVAPDAKIGALLDPHCHLTELMLQDATAIICFKEYPHIDVLERADELFRILSDAAEGKVNPVMRDYDCRIIMAMPTPEGPMRDWVDAMSARESEPGVLSLSLAHGFPWGDHERTGARALAVTDGDAPLAEKIARELGEKLWREKEAIFQQVLTIDEALDKAAGHNQGPIVLADMSDNAGGGAPSDSTFLLRAILERGLTSVASGIYWDPVVVRLCADVGEGAQLAVRLGGKSGPMSGDPLDLNVTIKRIGKGLSQRFGTLPVSLGTIVWLSIDRGTGDESDNIDLIVNDARTQTFHPEAFTQLGIDLSKKRHVCVKSSNHYRAGFAPMASVIIPIAAPGAITPDFTAIPYQHRSLNYWPRVENPFA